jgi:uncharacterized HAD superfamily protein
MKRLLILAWFVIFAVVGTSAAWTDESVSPEYQKYLANPQGVFIDVTKAAEVREKEKREYAKYKKNKLEKQKRTAKVASGDYF